MQGRVYRSRIHDVAQLKWRFIEEWNISTRISINRSGSGIHIFKLAFEHMEDILNTDLKYVVTCLNAAKSGHFSCFRVSLLAVT